MSATIVTYNVQSPELATESLNPGCLPRHLDAARRIELLKLKLTKEVVDRKAIACLQEVNAAWHKELNSFFLQRNYGTFARPGGKVGVMIAYPLSLYRLNRSSAVSPAKVISKLSRTQKKQFVARYGGIAVPTPGGKFTSWDSVSSRSAWLSSMRRLIARLMWIILWFACFIGPIAKRYGRYLPKLDRASRDDWSLAGYPKHLYLLMVELETVSADSADSADRRRFCVANYHAPCNFSDPYVMMMHAFFSGELAHVFAATSTAGAELPLPLIFGGDFNISPEDPAYQVLVAQNPFGLQSAFVRSIGSEPGFTNWTLKFKGTIDYFLISHHWRIIQAIAPTAPSTPACPNDTEPSDHHSLTIRLSLASPTPLILSKL
jgi:hypothetical protein